MNKSHFCTSPPRAEVLPGSEDYFQEPCRWEHPFRPKPLRQHRRYCPKKPPILQCCLGDVSPPFRPYCKPSPTRPLCTRHAGLPISPKSSFRPSCLFPSAVSPTPQRNRAMFGRNCAILTRVLFNNVRGRAP